MLELNVLGGKYYVTFIHSKRNISKNGHGAQHLTFCVIRPHRSAETYVGHSVKNPNDEQNDPSEGERWAFKRAIMECYFGSDLYAGYDMDEVDHIFRHAMWELNQKS